MLDGTPLLDIKPYVPQLDDRARCEERVVPRGASIGVGEMQVGSPDTPDSLTVGGSAGRRRGGDR